MDHFPGRAVIARAPYSDKVGSISRAGYRGIVGHAFPPCEQVYFGADNHKRRIIDRRNLPGWRRRYDTARGPSRSAGRLRPRAGRQASAPRCHEPARLGRDHVHLDPVKGRVDSLIARQ